MAEVTGCRSHAHTHSTAAPSALFFFLFEVAVLAVVVVVDGVVAVTIVVLDSWLHGIASNPICMYYYMWNISGQASRHAATDTQVHGEPPQVPLLDREAHGECLRRQGLHWGPRVSHRGEDAEGSARESGEAEGSVLSCFHGFVGASVPDGSSPTFFFFLETYSQVLSWSLL